MSKVLAENVYARLLDSAPDAMLVVDERGTIVLANEQTEKMFGFPRAELEGQPIEVLVPGRYRDRHVGQRNGFISNPTARPMGGGSQELVGLRKDGSEFPVEISLSPVPTQERMLVAAAVRDITSRRRVEIAARQVSERLASAVESIQGALAIFDGSDRLVLCNSECRVLLGGVAADAIVGKTFGQILDGAIAGGTFVTSDEPTDALRTRWLAYHHEPSGTLDVRTADGRTMRVTERRTPEGGSVVTIWDLTEDVEREAEIRRARAAAESASAAKSEFLASMSHELRTPLNAILGFAQLLQRDKKTPLSERQHERVAHVLKAGEHLLRLIDEVLDLARIEAGRLTVSLEPVEIHEVLEEVESTLRPIADRASIALSVAPIAGEVPKVLADRTRFAQVLMNFGSNAIKYGRAGGSLTFVVQRPGSDRVRVTAEDDGIGIPASKQDKVFQPFQRAGQETGAIEGTGIGLTISKRLAEVMHGNVGFASEEGTGSKFWIELPVAGAPAALAVPKTASGAAASPLAANASGRRHLVLYVEDNPSNIALMEDLLADFDGIELVTAPSAEIGIEIARAQRPALVIMDINLPGLSGVEATRQLQTWPETRTVPVIALTAAAMARDAPAIASAGFRRVLTKPVRVDELVMALETFLPA